MHPLFCFLDTLTTNIFVPPSLLDVVKTVVSSLLHSVYGIRLKWEPHGARVVRGEGSLAPDGDKLSLLRKGVILDTPSGDSLEWERWVDV